MAPLDAVFDRHNIAQPDVLFVGRERMAIITEDNVQGAPDLVVEILSKSTRRRDLTSKPRIYARHSVRYYWIIDPKAETLQPYEYEWEQDGYRQQPPLRAGDMATCPLFPGISADVASLFV